MKIVKRIIIWILLACAVEGAAFSYLDKYWLVADSSFKAVKVENNVDEKKVPKTEIKLSDDLNVKYTASSNGKYIMYPESNNIKIVNTATGDTDEIKPAESESISYFKWVQDSNRALIAKKHSDKKKFKLYYYDVNIKGKLTEVRNYMDGSLDGQEVAISIKGNRAEVEDIDLSPLNGVMYIKVKNNTRHAEVYRMDRMAYMQRLSNNELKSPMIGRMNSTKRSEKLIYEELVSGRIYATGVKSPLMPKGVSSACLLGIDSSDDTIYIGALENKKVTKIYYGKAEEAIDNWKSLQLTFPAKPAEIMIAPGGKVYLNNNLEGTITELKSWEQISYSGRMLQMYDGGVLSLESSVLQKEKINDQATKKANN